MDTITPEEIQQTYTAALDSVSLISTLVANETLTDEDKDTIKRNVDHLNIILAKDYWTTQDLTPFENAVATGNAVL